MTTWARTLNHRPRVDRDGRSRAELYRLADPTPEETDEARRALAELVRRQEQARLTLRARQDPVVRSMLDAAFTRLGLEDPEGHLRAAIGRYPLDHVVAGVAIFAGKRAASTLPAGVGARYLLGIVRNVSLEDEGVEIAEALWRARLAAQDEILLGLDRQRERVNASPPSAVSRPCFVHSADRRNASPNTRASSARRRGHALRQDRSTRSPTRCATRPTSGVRPPSATSRHTRGSAVDPR